MQNLRGCSRGDAGWVTEWEGVGFTVNWMGKEVAIVATSRVAG